MSGPAPQAQPERNVEIFVRHCAGDTYRALGKRYGISFNRVEQITKRAALRLVFDAPMTLPACTGAWCFIKKLRDQ